MFKISNLHQSLEQNAAAALTHSMDSSTPSSAHLSRRPLRTRLIQEDDDDDGGEVDSNNIDSPTHMSTPPCKSKSKPKPITTPPIRAPPHSPTPALVPSLQDLLLLSPPPYRKPRPRPVLLVDEAAAAAVALDASQSSATPRRRSKSRAAGASPRNARRARRRLEKEIVPFPVEDDIGAGINGGRVRISKRKQMPSTTPNKVSHNDDKEDDDDQKLCLAVASAASLPPTPTLQKKAAADDDDDGSSTRWGEQIWELVMWKNVAKSTLWFGLGLVVFISSCFSGDFNFSLISAASHLGILILGLAFFYDSVPQRQLQKTRGANFQLTEEDILRTARLILPMANAGLAKAQEVFSGEPSMTLKVAPILIFTANYGHLITPWRLLVTGFFLSFTIPKVYSCYSERLHNRVEEMTTYVWEAWKSCPRKNLVAASIAMMLWNIFAVKTRILAAFISVVVLRYHHQHHFGGKSDAK